MTNEKDNTTVLDTIRTLGGLLDSEVLPTTGAGDHNVVVNRYGFTEKEVKIIRKKIMDNIKKL